MEGFASFIGITVFFGLVFVLGDWLFQKLTGRLESRLRAGWRWLALPTTALLSFAGFLVLRPLILDQPQTPLWFVLAFVAIALLVTGATALAYAAIAVGRWLIEFLRGR